MKFGDAVRRVALAFIREKQLPESVWYGDRIDFTFTSLFWGALLLSASIVLSPLIWLLLQPVLYFMSQDISNPVERWLWLLLLVVFMVIVRVLDSFVRKADRKLRISYDDLGLGEKLIYWLASLAAFSWMFSPGLVTTMDRLFTMLLCMWYVFFCSILAGMF
ncbi:hypothetical protein [Microbulbifer sp. JMSA008]|uniref:hypothetical protein n=1 Tax=unclassified Microbulbifer TaxID=2619833 RepID=UPI00403A7DEE